MDGLSEVLSGADEDGHDDEHGGRVLAIQSVNEVIVKTELELLDVQNSLDYALHPSDANSTTSVIRQTKTKLLLLQE